MPVTEALHDLLSADPVRSHNSSWRTAMEEKLTLMSTALDMAARAERAPPATDLVPHVNSLAEQIADLDMRCVGLEEAVRGLAVTTDQVDRQRAESTGIVESLGLLANRLDRLEESVSAPADADPSLGDVVSRDAAHQHGGLKAVAQREVRSLVEAEVARTRAADAAHGDDIRKELADMRHAREAADNQLCDILGLLSTSLARVIDHLPGAGDDATAADAATLEVQPVQPTATPEARAEAIEPVVVDADEHHGFALVSPHPSSVDAFSPPALRGFAVPPRRPSFLQTLTGFGLRKVA